ncbi:hypothetical protein RRG08_054112 [Elysia crispata]|uniref:Uncharacterized protein n=1 Tax=Elysia crispata TaxID=231223 RepID=A0AAE0ZCT0_9GAST|nr:hypothetical protein RRG08_054112 [Elysia crispata]
MPFSTLGIRAIQWSPSPPRHKSLFILPHDSTSGPSCQIHGPIHPYPHWSRNIQFSHLPYQKVINTFRLWHCKRSYESDAIVLSRLEKVRSVQHKQQTGVV